MPKYQFVSIAADGRPGEALTIAAYDDAVAMKRALSLPGAAAWDIWRGVSHVALIAAPADAAQATRQAEPQREAA